MLEVHRELLRFGIFLKTTHLNWYTYPTLQQIKQKTVQNSSMLTLLTLSRETTMELYSDVHRKTISPKDQDRTGIRQRF